MDGISISEARADFKSVVERVVANRAPLAITRKKAEGVVLIADNEWVSIEETLYLLSSPTTPSGCWSASLGSRQGNRLVRFCYNLCAST